MAAATARDEEEIEKEATKLARLRIVSSQNEKELEQSKKNLESAKRMEKRYLRALDEVQSQTNVSQAAIATLSAGVGAGIGFAASKKAREYTDEKKWVNEKGERSIGAVMLGDVAPVVVGLTVMALGAFIDNGALGSGVMGLGGGIAGGSVLYTALGAPAKK